MKGKAEQIIYEQKSKTETIMQTLSQAIDVKSILNQFQQGSFNKIDEQLDQLLNDKFNFINKLSSQISSDLPKLNFNNLLPFQKDDFQNQINKEVIFLIYNNIEKQVQKNEQYYQNKQKEIQIKWERILKEKDTQIQQLQNYQDISQSSTFIQTQSNLKPFTYQLMQQLSIKQDEFCRAIAINKDCSILVAGCKSQIKVFDFNQGFLKQIQLLSEHSNIIQTLNFMKKSDQFISGSWDKSIIIWTRNQHNQWICQQQLNGHQNDINCVVINNNEDLIITGSDDNTIKFWQKNNEWQCQQTITDHNDAVYGLSLNEQQNRMISCGRDNVILVIEKSEQNKQFIVIQKIAVETFGFRLCFIDNNTFTFQPLQYQCMHIYEMNINTKQYIKTKDVPVKGGSDNCFFPQQYIKSKSILINKNASNVNIIRNKSNNEFVVEQFIDFGTKLIFGYLTEDGQYLITWDDKSKEFQIRKYYEK